LKSRIDELFDIALFIPLIFEQMDEILPGQATVSRRQKAVELLQNCLALEEQFNQWLLLASAGPESQPFPYWAEDLVSPGTEISFANSYTFRDGFTALMFQYYWMIQLLFHRCIDNLNRIVFQPVIDSYPDMWPDLPANLQIDPVRYQQGREFAANICRGLDSALNSTVQPDMLMGPMTVALDFSREMNTTSADGLLEIMWLEAFRGRLVAKGQHVATVLQQPQWTELANF
jgi:(R)-2-hydroxyglutarate---pyruvate transhydrogenase